MGNRLYRNDGARTFEDVTDVVEAHFGLGGADRVNELRVIWSGGEETVLTDVAANQVLRIE